MAIRIPARLALIIDFGFHVIGATLVFAIVLFVSMGVGAVVEWLVAHGWLHGYQRTDAEWAEWGISRLDLLTLGLYCICETLKLARALIVGLLRDWRHGDE